MRLLLSLFPFYAEKTEAQRVKKFFQSYIELGFKHRFEFRIV